MASSSWVGPERVVMEFDAVPAPLRDRLGPEATAGLIALIADAQKDWLPK